MTEEELIRRRGLLAALEHDGRGLVRADDLTDAEVEALTFGEFLGLLWRPTAEPCIDDLRDRVLMDRLVPGWAAWSLGWFRARSDPIRAMGLSRVASLPPRDDLSFAYLTVEARRAGRVDQANRACGPHQLTETNYPPIWTLQHMLESAVEEIEQEQNRLVVSDISGTVEGTIDLVDPEAIERARALREDLRFRPRGTIDPPTGPYMVRDRETGLWRRFDPERDTQPDGQAMFPLPDTPGNPGA